MEHVNLWLPQTTAGQVELITCRSVQRILKIDFKGLLTTAMGSGL